MYFALLPEFLKDNYQATFTVTGNSMWPFLTHGRDTVVVEACDPKHLKKGDIVLFQPMPTVFILHRVTKLKKNPDNTVHCFQTTGDGNCHRDGFYRPDCVIAKVSSLQRKGTTIACNSLFWRLVANLWNIAFPIRRYLLYTLRQVSRLRNR